jgi:hypothetical protein
MTADYTPIPFEYKGNAYPLSNGAIKRAADCLLCQPAAVLAVWDVETGSKPPFDLQGRPSILFERHVFSRLTRSQFDRIHPTLSNPVSGGYGKYSEQYYKLDMATDLDPMAAWKSCSWGMFQIMGFNCTVCGYPAVTDFVAAMCNSADEQLEAFVKFVQANALGAYLRDRNWTAFARGYNGPAFEKFRYHKKLADAFLKHGGRNG